MHIFIIFLFVKKRALGYFFYFVLPNTFELKLDLPVMETFKWCVIKVQWHFICMYFVLWIDLCSLQLKYNYTKCTAVWLNYYANLSLKKNFNILIYRQWK